jgi:hypothetical protein
LPIAVAVADNDRDDARDPLVEMNRARVGIEDRDRVGLHTGRQRRMRIDGFDGDGGRIGRRLGDVRRVVVEEVRERILRILVGHRDVAPIEHVIVGEADGRLRIGSGDRHVRPGRARRSADSLR